MDHFQQSGEAMLLAHQGQRQIAAMVAAKLRSMVERIKAWHAAMPGTLPPTESQPR